MATNKIYVSAKTVEDAIEKGLKELNASLEEISYETVNEGGIFSKAKIAMWIDETISKSEEKHIKIIADHEYNENFNDNKNIKVEDKLTDKIKSNSTTSNSTNNNFYNHADVKLTKEEIDEVTLKTEEFLSRLAKFADENATLTKEDNETSVNFNIEGSNLGNIIGNGGETLSAVQLIANVIAGKKRGYHKRIFVDAGHYKSEKDSELIELAKKTAEEVRRTGESIKLKPLTAYQRRVVHAALAEEEDVTTKSIGEEPNRNLFVLPKMKF